LIAMTFGIKSENRFVHGEGSICRDYFLVVFLTARSF
jgi:hypothetical protein